VPIVINNQTSVAIGADYYVEVLGGPVGGVLIPISFAGTNTIRIKLNPDGFFDAGIGVVPGLKDNAVAEFQVRVWRGLPTYELAHMAGVITGISPR
jgi:hypothetical protein